MTEQVPARSVTLRGFTIYDEFTDDYGHQVRVQKSSNAMRDCAWIFCNGDDDENPSPHLAVEHAARVRDALDVFIREHGGDAPRTVTFDLSDVSRYTELTEALADRAAAQREQAKIEGGNALRERWADLDDRMREQAEAAFSGGTEAGDAR